MGKNKGEMKYHTLKESLKNDILSGVYKDCDELREITINREIRCRQRIN